MDGWISWWVDGCERTDLRKVDHSEIPEYTLLKVQYNG